MGMAVSIVATELVSIFATATRVSDFIEGYAS